MIYAYQLKSKTSPPNREVGALGIQFFSFLNQVQAFFSESSERAVFIDQFSAATRNY